MGYIRYGNRGMFLEEIIKMANTRYAYDNVGTIQKISTPVRIINIDHYGNVKGRLGEKSTVDFIGVYKGHAIAFDAKETRDERKFPLAEIQEHQLKFLTNFGYNGGLAFIIIYFTKLERYFKVSIDTINRYIQNPDPKNKKSMTIKFLEENALELKVEVPGPGLYYMKDVFYD